MIFWLGTSKKTGSRLYIMESYVPFNIVLLLKVKKLEFFLNCCPLFIIVWLDQRRLGVEKCID
jgi:hypothetical protein